MFKQIHSALRTIQLLSIDVMLGAMIFSLAIAKVINAFIPLASVWALGIAVWMIYTLDHLSDAIRLKDTASMARHLFHAKYKNILIVALLIAACLGLWLLTYLPENTVKYGGVMVGFMLLYFAMVWLFDFFFSKEIIIAILYACGVFLSPWSESIGANQSMILPFIQVILLAAINLLIFSYYEREQDRQDGQISWATRFGMSVVRQHLNGLFLLLICSYAFGFWYYFEQPDLLLLQFVFLIMASVFYAVFKYERWCIRYDRYRWIGDGVFFLPGLLLL